MSAIEIELDCSVIDAEDWLTYKYLLRFLKKSSITKADYCLTDKVDLNDMVCS